MSSLVRRSALFGAFAFLLLAPGSGAAQEELPLVEVPADGAGGSTLALLISGDGNWAKADKEIAVALAARNIPVVGLKARAYLSRKPTPDQAARDVEMVLRRYLERWSRERIILIGYSRGADMMPFIANRLPPDLRRRIRMIALLGPSVYGSFEFHLSDLFRETHRPTDLPLLPEVERLGWTEVLCVYGTREKNSLCRSAPAGHMRVVARPGGHRIHDGRAVADILLEALDGSRSGPAPRGRPSTA